MRRDVSMDPAPAAHAAVLAAAEDLAGRAADVARTVLHEATEAVPFYRSLPAEELEGDIRAIVVEHLLLLPRLVREHRVPTDRELERARRSVAARAQEGVPLDAILAIYVFAAEAVWAELVDRAGPAVDPAAIHGLTALVFRFLRVAIEAVSATYLEERQAIVGEQQEARRRVVAALLAGRPIADADRSGAPRIPAEFIVLSLAVGPHPDEHDAGARATIATRRKLRRITATLDEAAGEPVLTALDAEGGTVLLPGDRAPLAGERRWDAVAALVGRLEEAAGAPVRAGAAEGPPAAVAEAAAEAREVRDVARAIALEGAVHRLADVLVEYQLSRASRATPALRAVLEPLVSRPELLETLRVHLSNDLRRRDTALMLHVHPNTVDYRLRRITELTGLDPNRPRDAQRLLAAFAAAL